MTISKRQRVSGLTRVFLLITSLLFVSGQLSAYPLMCAMPDMQMGAMDSDSIEMDTKHGATVSMGVIAIDHSMESDPGTMHEISNCEQICGYCINQNLPSSEVSGLFISLRSTKNLDLYLPPTPSGFYRDLFRPPISV